VGDEEMRAPLTSAELVDNLVAVVTSRWLDPLEIVLDDGDLVDALRARVVLKAKGWAAEMLGDDDDDYAAGRAAYRLIGALYPSDEPFNPPAQWWLTPLGQVVAQRVGFPGVEGVSVAVAAAMLGVSRQFVHDLVKRGKLDRSADGGVSVTSIRARINERNTR
jgi:hypothetical protein